MILHGIDPFELPSLKRKILTKNISDQREARLLELFVVVNAIREGATRIAGGQTDGAGVRDAFNAYRDLLFPELREEKAAKAVSSKVLLEREFKKGPMIARAIDDGKGQRKKMPKRKKN